MERSRSAKNRFGRIGRLSAAALCLITLPAWSACQPDRDAPAPESPYRGYAPTGYKGATERDPVWHRAVHQVKGRNGAPLFELKQRPGARFASIVPIDLGGVNGFVALRDGCWQLLGPQGEPQATPLFDTIEPESLDPKLLGPGQALLKLKAEGSFVWARLGRGRLLAVSPRPYLTSYSGSSLPAGFLAPSLRDVAASFDDGHGLVDLRTLEEVLAPQWSGVAGVGVIGDTQPTRYLMAARGPRRSLFPLEGGPALLESIVSLELLNRWLPRRPASPAVDRAVLLVRKEGEAGCRLLDLQLQPLMPHLLPLRHDVCELDRLPSDRKYLFTDAGGEAVQAYAVEPEGPLRWLSSTPGQLEAALEATGLMVVRVQGAQGTVHRVYFADGRRSDEEDYTGFRNLGCRFLEVQRQGQWLTLFPDGHTSKERFFPFSC